MGRHAVTVVLLLAALACYGAELRSGGLLLFFLGAVLELWFWIHAIQAPRHLHAQMRARVILRR